MLGVELVRRPSNEVGPHPETSDLLESCKERGLLLGKVDWLAIRSGSSPPWSSRVTTPTSSSTASTSRLR